MLVSVVIPALNEPHLDELIAEIHNALAYQHEVLVQTEKGIGNAVWHGIQNSKGQFIAVMDGDGSHKVSDLACMVESIISLRHIDLVVATRIWNHYPLHRRIISQVSAWFTNNFLCLHLHDPMAAFFVGRREVMVFRNDRKGCKFGLEILSRVNRLRVYEYPILHEPLKGHKSKLHWMEAVWLIGQLLRLKVWRSRV